MMATMRLILPAREDGRALRKSPWSNSRAGGGYAPQANRGYGEGAQDCREGASRNRRDRGVVEDWDVADRARPISRESRQQCVGIGDAETSAYCRRGQRHDKGLT